MTTPQTDFTIQQGVEWSINIACQDSNGDPVSLAGYSGAMEARTEMGNVLLFRASTVNGLMVITEATGTVSVTLPQNQTLAFTPGDYVYDVLLTDSSGTREKKLRGAITVEDLVTEIA